MADTLRIGREWTQDGDRMFARAQAHLARVDTAFTASEREQARLDFWRASQMYVTGAIHYQRGPEAVARANPGLATTAELMRHLEGSLQTEAFAALEAVTRQAARADAQWTAMDRARLLAQALRDRLAAAVPELFDRPTPSVQPPQPARLH